MRVLCLSDILNARDERLLEALRAAGHQVTLLTFFRREPELPAFTKAYDVVHERYDAYPDGSGASRWSLVRGIEYRRDEARACLKTKELMRSRRFEVVLANWALTSGYVAAHAGAHPLALFPWGSDLLVWPRLHRVFAQRATKALRSADLVVCNSKTAAAEARRLGRLWADRLEILPIELDGGRFEPRPRNEKLRASWGLGDRTVVISTRPLKELYDHKTLFSALARPGMEGFGAVLVGEGNLREDLERRAREIKIDDRVFFAGAVEMDQVPEHLASADLYVTCSRSDSASLGLLEAMAIGLPVIASDIPANREWVANGQSGWSFPVGGVDVLAEALQEAMADGENRDQVALRGRAVALARGDARKNLPRLVKRLEALGAAGRRRR